MLQCNNFLLINISYSFSFKNIYFPIRNMSFQIQIKDIRYMNENVFRYSLYLSVLYSYFLIYNENKVYNHINNKQISNLFVGMLACLFTHIAHFSLYYFSSTNCRWPEAMLFKSMWSKFCMPGHTKRSRIHLYL